VARFASWNLHWFPDGKPGSGGAGADLAWLSCALWWLDADVVAVQEVKQGARADAALAQVLSQLSQHGGARYLAQLDDCGTRVPQHVGLIWNAARVQASELSTVAALNPSGEACAQQWRPGFSARLRFPGGLDLLALSAHFKSGSDARSLALRRGSFGALPGVARDNEIRSGDPDLLLLGDLNTMGCEECDPPVPAHEELGVTADALRRQGLRLVPADAPGTHFHDGKPALLDHAVASQKMAELDARKLSRVLGACAAGAPAPGKRAAKKARQQLSDHCPLVVDLTDRDLD
jgi:endonuclease/exonuclease/phosphatase family metal-dependent hydrolase